MNQKIGKLISNNSFQLTIAAILIALGSFVIVSKTSGYHETHPVPSGDAQEYFWQSEVIYNFAPSDNQMLDRWPGFPLVVAGIWKITGKSVLVQYLASATCHILSCVLIFIFLYKNGKPVAAQLSLFLLLFNPLIIKYSIVGLTESLYVLLILVLYVFLFRSDYRWLTLLLLGISSVLLVLSKEEGKYVLAWATVLVLIKKFRSRKLNLKIVLSLITMVVAAGAVLFLFILYEEKQGILPISNRIGKFYFYREFLSDKMMDYNLSLSFSMLSPLDWLMLHSPGEIFKLFVHSIKTLYVALDSYFFPGSTVLIISGMIAAIRYGYLYEAVIIIPFVSFFAFQFHLQTELRYPLSFLILAVPLALAGIESFVEHKSKLRGIPAGVTIIALLTMSVVFWNMDSFHDPVKIFGRQGDKPEKKFEDSLFLGLDSGNWEYLARVSQEGCRQYPRWIYFRVGFALTDYRNGEVDKACQTLNDIIAEVPWITEIQYVKYYLLQLDGRAVEAAETLVAALEWRPEFKPFRDIAGKLKKEGYLPESYSLPDPGRSPFTVYLNYSFLEIKTMKSFLWWCSTLDRLFPADGRFPAVIPK